MCVPCTPRPTAPGMSSGLQVFCSDMTFCLHHGAVTGESIQITAWCLNGESFFTRAHPHTLLMAVYCIGECTLVRILMLAPDFLSCRYSAWWVTMCRHQNVVGTLSWEVIEASLLTQKSEWSDSLETRHFFKILLLYSLQKKETWGIHNGITISLHTVYIRIKIWPLNTRPVHRFFLSSHHGYWQKLTDSTSYLVPTASPAWVHALIRFSGTLMHNFASCWGKNDVLLTAIILWCYKIWGSCQNPCVVWRRKMWICSPIKVL